MQAQSNSQPSQSAIVIKPFGGNGGTEFSMQCPTSIGISTGSEVDQIRIKKLFTEGKGEATKDLLYFDQTNTFLPLQ